MNCYLCEKTPGPGGTHFHVKAAFGVCHNCGVDVCAKYSHKDEQPGAPLLCPPCAKLLNAETSTQLSNHIIARQN